MDALQRACPPGARAALERLRRAGLVREVQGSELAVLGGRLELPVEPGDPAVAVALAGWALRCAGVEPRLSRSAGRQLDSAVGQLDRLWGPGAGMRALLDELDRLWRRVDPDTEIVTAHHGELGERVHSLAYVVRGVRRKARDAVAYDRFARGLTDTPHPRGMVARVDERGRPIAPADRVGDFGPRERRRVRHTSRRS